MIFETQRKINEVRKDDLHTNASNDSTNLILFRDPSIYWTELTKSSIDSKMIGNLISEVANNLNISQLSENKSRSEWKQKAEKFNEIMSKNHYGITVKDKLIPNSPAPQVEITLLKQALVESSIFNRELELVILLQSWKLSGQIVSMEYLEEMNLLMTQRMESFINVINNSKSFYNAI